MYIALYVQTVKAVLKSCSAEAFRIAGATSAKSIVSLFTVSKAKAFQLNKDNI